MEDAEGPREGDPAAEEENGQHQSNEAPDENGEIGASEEEALEEIMDSAVRLLQGLYRARKARRALQDLVRASFVKEYDKENDRFLYRNKLNGHVSATKPLLLGDKDLPDPKIHVAPDGFTVRSPCMRHFALVVTVSEFDSPKLPDLDRSYSDHHTAVQDTLVHPYLSQYADDDSIFALNPSLDVVKQHLDTLQRVVGQHGSSPSSLLVYFTTHVINVPRGLDRGAYFACADTNFQSTSLVRRSSISASELAQFVRGLPCTDKTIILNVAHLSRPKSTLLRSKFLYPPNSLYTTISKDSGAVVLGACRIGPSCEKQAEKKQKSSAGKTPSAAASGGPFADAGAGSGAIAKPDPIEAEGCDEESGTLPGQDEVPETKASVGPEVAEDVKPKRPRQKRGRWFSRNPKIADKDEETQDRGQAADSDGAGNIGMEPPQSTKGMRVVRNEDGTYAVADKWDKYREARQRAKERFFSAPARAYQGTVGRAYNYVSERRRRKAQERSTKLSTYEVAELRNGASVFGSGLVKALTGAAGDYKKNVRITARQLSNHLKLVYAAKHMTQAVILCFAKEPELDLKTVVATLPSVHPPPLRAQLVKTTMTTLLLEWELPSFTGAKPLEYELQMRGIAKYNKVWKVVGGFATIRRKKFLVPHLTSGIEHQFRVRARNYGGWSDFSGDSELFVPCAARTMSVEETMKTAAERGIPNLIKTMTKYRTSEEALLLGCWMLNTKALLGNGFKRCSTSKDIIEVILDTMNTFPSNATLQATTLLVLGWACYGHTGAADFAIEKGALGAVDKAKEAFPSNSAVHGNALWAAANMKQGDHQTNLPARVKKQREAELPLVAMQHGYFR